MFHTDTCYTQSQGDGVAPAIAAFIPCCGNKREPLCPHAVTKAKQMQSRVAQKGESIEQVSGQS